MNPSTAYISLGSNLGEPEKNLARALELFAGCPGIRAAAVSSLYQTEPQGLRDQPFFVNQAARLFCDAGFTPLAVLESLQGIENALGRERSGPRFGPRVIDLDLLLFGNVILEDPRLILPHPRMLERAFVLVPLAELAPDLFLPQGMTVREALARIAYRMEGRVIFQHCSNGKTPVGEA